MSMTPERSLPSTLAADPRRGAHLTSDDDHVLLATAVTSRRAVSPRCDMVRQGETPTGIYLILEGWAIRCRQLPDGTRQILAVLLPGDVCIDPPERALNHAIVAVTPVRYGVIPYPEFGPAAATPPDLMAALWRRQLEMSSIQLEWLANSGRSAYERIAHFLCETFSRAKDCGLTTGDECEFPLTQQDIAEVTGLTSVHVNRTLQQLRRDGLIALHGRKLVMNDRRRLGQVALFKPAYLHFATQQA